MSSFTSINSPGKMTPEYVVDGTVCDPVKDATEVVLEEVSIKLHYLILFIQACTIMPNFFGLTIS